MINEWTEVSEISQLMTRHGSRIEDGRYLCVVQGPLPTYSPRSTFCVLEDGAWFDDDLFQGGTELPDWMRITHVRFEPLLPKARP